MNFFLIIFVLIMSHAYGCRIAQSLISVNLYCNKCNKTYPGSLRIEFGANIDYDDDRYVDMSFINSEYSEDRLEALYLMDSLETLNLTYGVDYVKNFTTKSIVLYSALKYSSFQIKNFYMQATYNRNLSLFAQTYKNRNSSMPLEYCMTTFSPSAKMLYDLDYAYERADLFHYYNMTLRFNISDFVFDPTDQFVILPGYRVVLPGMPGAQPEINTFNKDSYIIPIKNSQIPNLSYSYGKTGSIELIFVKGLFPRKLQYPDDYVEIKFVNLLPPINMLATVPMIVFNDADNFYSYWGTTYNTLKLSVYYSPIINEDDFIVNLYSKNSGANMLNNITFNFNFTVPLINKQDIFLGFIDELPIPELMANELAYCEINENNFEYVGFDPKNLSTVRYYPNNNSFNITILPTTFINFVNNQELQNRSYYSFNLTLVNVRNPNKVFNSTYFTVILRSQIPFAITSPYVPLNYSSKNPSNVINFTAIYLKDYEISFTSNVFNKVNEISFQFRSPGMFRYDSFFLIKFDEEIISFEDDFQITECMGFDNDPLNITRVNSSAFLISNPFKTNLTDNSLIKFKIFPVILKNELVKPIHFNTTVYNSDQMNNAICLSDEITVNYFFAKENNLVNATINQFSSNKTYENQSFVVNFCYDLTFPIPSSGILYEFTINNQFFILNKEEFQLFMDGELYNVTFIENNRFQIHFLRKTSYFLHRLLDCPNFKFQGIQNQRSAGDQNFSIYVKAIGENNETIAEKSIEAIILLEPSEFFQNAKNFSFTPNILNYQSTLDFSFSVTKELYINETLSLNFPSIFQVFTSQFVCTLNLVEFNCELENYQPITLKIKLNRNISQYEELNLQIFGVKTPMKYWESLDDFTLTASDKNNFLLYIQKIKAEFPSLEPTTLKQIDFQRTSFFLSDISNVSYIFKIPIDIEDSMPITFFLDGDQEFLTENNMFLLKIHDFNGNLLTNLFGIIYNGSLLFQPNLNLTENMKIELVCMFFKNPSNISSTQTIDFGISVKQTGVNKDILIYKESRENYWVCNQSCAECIDRSDFCLECTDTTYFLNQSCYEVCPNEYDEQIISGKKICNLTSNNINNESNISDANNTNNSNSDPIVNNTTNDSTIKENNTEKENTTTNNNASDNIINESNDSTINENNNTEKDNTTTNNNASDNIINESNDSTINENNNTEKDNTTTNNNASDNIINESNDSTINENNNTEKDNATTNNNASDNIINENNNTEKENITQNNNSSNISEANQEKNISMSSLDPSNIVFINTDFDNQFFLTYYVIVTGLYVLISSLLARRQKKKVDEVKAILFFWSILEIFCLYLMFFKLAVLQENILMSFFLILLIVVYVVHTYFMRKIFMILKKDDNFSALYGKNKFFKAFNYFIFVWNYRMVIIFPSKVSNLGHIIKEEPVIFELLGVLKKNLLKQLPLQGISVILLIVFLSVSLENFSVLPFFFIEFFIFEVVFIMLSIKESFTKEDSIEITENPYKKDEIVSGSPTLSPTSIQSPMGNKQMTINLKKNEMSTIPTTTHSNGKKEMESEKKGFNFQEKVDNYV